MDLLFLGTPAFSLAPLEKLHQRHKIMAVITQPERPRGRNLKLQPSPVKKWAEEAKIPVLEPARVNDEDVVNKIRQMAPEAIVMAAYGQILSADLLKVPKYGCINIHASFLPALRGAAPIQRAIMDGLRKTGVTIMKMDEGMDTGVILDQAEIAIEVNDDSGTLSGKIAALGADLIDKVLDGLADGNILEKPQANDDATFSPPIKKEELRIDWRKSAPELVNQIRALQPAPGAFTIWRDKRLKIGGAEAMEMGKADPGVTIVENDQLLVGTGLGVLKISEVQPAGKKNMPTEQFIRGYRPRGGEIMG
ncbi:MAG: methionyl-tRNA formyltransferase [Actinomycetia bacterium]|nr:methionyl-tRNA formyltransferase [Actinomycetes bacterium]